MRRAHVYKEYGTYASWWTFDVFETTGPVRASHIVTGTRKTWAQALEAAQRWLSTAIRPPFDEQG